MTKISDHGFQRAYDRYGIVVGKDMLVKLGRLIRRGLQNNGKTTADFAVIKGQARAKPVLRVRLDGTDYILSYDRAADVIITFLPAKLERGYKKKEAAACHT